MRKEWVNYFESQGVRVVFFSAISQQNLDTTSKRNEIGLSIFVIIDFDFQKQF